MNRRSFLASALSLAAAPSATSAMPPVDSTPWERTRVGPRPEWSVTVHVDIPREMYDHAKEKYDGDQWGLDGQLFEHISWDYRWTIEGETVEDLPSP